MLCMQEGQTASLDRTARAVAGLDHKGAGDLSRAGLQQGTGRASKAGGSHSSSSQSIKGMDSGEAVPTERVECP